MSKVGELDLEATLVEDPPYAIPPLCKTRQSIQCQTLGVRFENPVVQFNIF